MRQDFVAKRLYQRVSLRNTFLNETRKKFKLISANTTLDFFPPSSMLFLRALRFFTVANILPSLKVNPLYLVCLDLTSEII